MGYLPIAGPIDTIRTLMTVPTRVDGLDGLETFGAIAFQTFGRSGDIDPKAWGMGMAAHQLDEIAGGAEPIPELIAIVADDANIGASWVRRVDGEHAFGLRFPREEILGLEDGGRGATILDHDPRLQGLISNGHWFDVP